MDATIPNVVRPCAIPVLAFMSLRSLQPARVSSPVRMTFQRRCGALMPPPTAAPPETDSRDDLYKFSMPTERNVMAAGPNGQVFPAGYLLSFPETPFGPMTTFDVRGNVKARFVVPFPTPSGFRSVPTSLETHIRYTLCGLAAGDRNSPEGGAVFAADDRGLMGMELLSCEDRFSASSAFASATYRLSSRDVSDEMRQSFLNASCVQLWTAVNKRWFVDEHGHYVFALEPLPVSIRVDVNLVRLFLLAFLSSTVDIEWFQSGAIAPIGLRHVLQKIRQLIKLYPKEDPFAMASAAIPLPSPRPVHSFSVMLDELACKEMCLRSFAAFVSERLVIVGKDTLAIAKELCAELKCARVAPPRADQPIVIVNARKYVCVDDPATWPKASLRSKGWLVSMNFCLMHVPAATELRMCVPSTSKRSGQAFSGVFNQSDIGFKHVPDAPVYLTHLVLRPGVPLMSLTAPWVGQRVDLHLQFLRQFKEAISDRTRLQASMTMLKLITTTPVTAGTQYDSSGCDAFLKGRTSRASSDDAKRVCASVQVSVSDACSDVCVWIRRCCREGSVARLVNPTTPIDCCDCDRSWRTRQQRGARQQRRRTRTRTRTRWREEKIKRTQFDEHDVRYVHLLESPV